MNIAIRKEIEWGIFFIFLAGLSIRILYVFQILQFPLTEYLVRSNTFDQHTFDSSAIKIVSDSWIGNEVFGKEPLYPYFLAMIYKIFGYSHASVYLVQAILTSIAVILLHRITTYLFNRITGYIAAFIFTFYSLSIYYDAILLRASLITFLNILLLYVILRAQKLNTPKVWLSAGMVLGLLMLMRRNMLLPFILIFILYTLRPLKKAFKYALIFSLGMFIVILPVVLRNYVVSDYRYIGISKEVNAFWVGNNPASSGVEVNWSREYHYLNNKSENSIIKTAIIFLEEVKKQPKIYARLYLRKIWMFFNAYEAPSNTNYYLYREEFPTILRWPFFNFQFVCASALIGIFLSLFIRPRPWIAYIFFIVLSVSVVLFHIQDRFRLPVVPFFIIFSSYSIYYIFSRLKNGYYLKLVGIVAVFLFLYLILRPDLTYGGFRKEEELIRPLDRTNLALAYIDAYYKNRELYMLQLALRQSDLALRFEKKDPIPYHIKGYIFLLEKKYSVSIAEYKKAIIYDNKNPFLYNELGGVYHGAHDYKMAFIYISRALHLFPGNKIFEKNLSLLKNENQ